MTTQLAETRRSLTVPLIQAPLHELYISWRFIGGDISSTIIPGNLFLTAALLHYNVSLGQSLRVFAIGIVYFWLYIYGFCLQNQYCGIEEDRLNKPHRPIISGLVTPRGTLIRWVIVMILFAALGWALGVLRWTLLWQVTGTLHDMGRWSRVWFTKNLAMSVGQISQLAAGWEIVGPLTPLALQWVLAISAVVLMGVALQDLRDMVGDRANKRVTFPLAVGEWPTRWYLAVVFALTPLIVHFGMIAPAGLTPIALALDAVLAGLCGLITVRVLTRTTSRHDHGTYLLFTYWYSLLPLSAMFLLS